MIKQKLIKDLKQVVEKLGFESSDIVVSIPQNPNFGDYTTNIPLQLANQKSPNRPHSPLEIAKLIKQDLDSRVESQQYLAKIEIAGPGFLNFFLKPSAISLQLSEIIDRGQDFGKNTSGRNQKVQVEFISANPTGPLTLANGRGGAVGDSLSNVLEWNGYQVEREYYINDTGNQVRTLAESVLAAAGKLDPQEEHYKGEYVQELAETFKDSLEDDPQTLGHKLADYLLEKEIKPAIKRLGINFDSFFSERSLYPDKIDQALKVLKEKGLSYQKDGAIWFNATKFGDDKDRVLVTSEMSRTRQEPTYFLADIAHHLMVFDQGFVKKINIFGADHHSYAKRLSDCLKAILGEDRVAIVIIQLVRLFKDDHQEVKMSKRAGTYVTLNELLNELSPDVIRFFFLMNAETTHLDFNLDLAKQQSSKNPVFYVQYAHARISNILKKAAKIEEVSDLTLLTHPKEIDLINHLTILPDLVFEIGRDYKVHRLTTYATTLADKFHQFYENCPVLQAKTPDLVQARLTLVKASQIVLANTLALMGISAPEKM